MIEGEQEGEAGSEGEGEAPDEGEGEPGGCCSNSKKDFSDIHRLLGDLCLLGLSLLVLVSYAGLSRRP